MRSLVTTFCVSLCSVLYAFDATIPVLHLPDYYEFETRQRFLDELEKAASEVGFFALTGTDVNEETLNTAYDQAKEFFALSFTEKMALRTMNGHRGYFPGESAKGEARSDVKEFYHIGRELPDEELIRLQYAKNVWPEKPKNFEFAMLTLYNSLDHCKDSLSEAFSKVMMQDSNYLGEMTKEGDCLMRAIHYPANPPVDAVWAAPHTDINLFTILPRSTAPGLQLLNPQGEWVDVVVPAGAFIVNCGDMLENLSNGYFRSAVHRVVDPGFSEERYSMTLFVHPRSADKLDPLPEFIEKTGGVRKYAKVSRIELLAERLIDLGLAPQSMMEFFVNSGAIDRLKEVGRFSPKAEATLRQAGFAL